MTESRPARMLLRLGAGATLAFIYFPLVVIAIYAFNENISQTWPIEHYTTKWFSVAWHNPDVRDALSLSVKAGARRDGIALVLGTLAALAVSRSRFFGREIDLVPRHPPDRAARDHHGARAAGDDPERPRPDRHQLQHLDDRHRARDLLHRRPLQQRRRTDAPRLRRPRRGVDGPRRRRLADVPVRDVPAAALGAARRCAARVRALVRRGRGDDLHVGRAADPADLDLHQLRTAARAPRGERRRALRDHRVDHPGLDRAAGRGRDAASRPTGPGQSAVAASIEAEP